MSDPIGQLKWRYEDLAWHDKVRAGSDTNLLVREALRHAVDIRDKHTLEPLGARPIFLVAVLNRLCEVLDVDTSELWDSA